VTSGKVSTREALAVGAVLALAAFALVLTTNTLTVLMSFAALAITLAYPYAKRYVSMPQAVLGVAFSFGVPMAFAAVQAQLPPLAWVLLVGNLFWVLAYDTEYAMVDRDDDLRIGMKTSAITLGAYDVPAVTAFYLVFLAIWTAALWPMVNSWVWGAMLVVAAHQGPQPRRLLQGLPPQPLVGVHGVCGCGARLGLKSLRFVLGASSARGCGVPCSAAVPRRLVPPPP